MRVAFDSVVLGAYLHPEAAYPRPVDRVPERLNHLVETLEAAHAKIRGRNPAKDGDGNYLATCRAQEPQSSGTFLNVVGKVILITVLTRSVLPRNVVVAAA